MNIFVDTQGPQIANVFLPDSPFFDLFDPKPSTDGATPLVFSLSISLFDLPNRDTINFPNYTAILQAVASNPGHYRVEGDHVGIIPVQSVQVVLGPDIHGAPATATITLIFASPLPDDRYTLTISDSITDPANNALDGESNANQPLEIPQFPSGDGVPGGDFVARFTVDSRPELGVFGSTQVHLDINGNFQFDPQGINNDQVNRDLVHIFGSTSDSIFAGKFGPAPITGRRFDQLAAYGNINGTFRWLIDITNDGVPDINNIQPTAINGLPVAGNFDGILANGDEIGLFDGTRWFRDLNRNFVIEPNEGLIIGTMAGFPVAGDFDGDGRDDVATYQNNVYFIDLATNGLSGNPDQQIAFGFPGVSERPAAADLDGDGIDDLGLFVPHNLNQTPTEASEWYFLLSNDLNGTRRIAGSVVTLNHPFSPAPLGSDLYAQFGDEPPFPVVGNFDPPPSISSTDTVDPDSNHIVALGAGAGGGPQVRVVDSESGAEKFTFFAYDPRFTGGVRVATGDINGDGVLDIITGPGAGGGPNIKVFDGRTGQRLPGAIGNFMAYDPRFTGGVFVASDDVNGDGFDDVIVAPGLGGGPNIIVFSGANGSVLMNFFAYDPNFTAGVNVAAGDVNGDGRADIITGAGAGGGPHVRVISGANGSELHNFFAYSPAFFGGVHVAAGDINGDGRADIITGAGAGGGPHVRVINGANGSELRSFFAYSPAFFGGVRVAATDFNRDGLADILASPGAGGGPQIRGFGGAQATHVVDFFGFDPNFTGGVYVASTPNMGQALKVAGGALVSSVDTRSVSQTELDTIVAAAIGRWEQAGLDAASLDRLRSVEVRTEDLAGAHLGLAYRDLVLIDLDAAGHGWFIDATPYADEEFVMAADTGRGRSGEAVSLVDLLSVVQHELGHLLGLVDLDVDLHSDDLMAEELAAGIRRVANTDDVDDVFASGEW